MSQLLEAWGGKKKSVELRASKTYLANSVQKKTCKKTVFVAALLIIAKKLARCGGAHL
jgi:hypothetical protein